VRGKSVAHIIGSDRRVAAAAIAVKVLASKTIAAEIGMAAGKIGVPGGSGYRSATEMSCTANMRSAKVSGATKMAAAKVSATKMAAAKVTAAKVAAAEMTATKVTATKVAAATMTAASAVAGVSAAR
jgi:hypothetical protein